MPWVALKNYSNAGTRHYSFDEPVRAWGAREMRRNGVIVMPFNDTAVFLCRKNDYGDHPVTKSGYVQEYTYNGTKGSHSSGGMTTKKSISLLQKNICASCLKKYLIMHPEYQVFMDALKGAE